MVKIFKKWLKCFHYNDMLFLIVYKPNGVSMNELKPIIKVLGVGGGGCNAVAYMSHAEIEGVEFLAANTDAQDLEKLTDIKKIQLGVELTGGLGAGANPKIGKKSAEENREEIRKSLEGANLVFISAGMGGGTGTGAAPVVAEIAKELGMLVVAVVTKPFDYERKQRMDQAISGISSLQEHVDAIIIIPNEKLRDVIPAETALSKVFEQVDQVLYKAIQGISDIITKRGLINIDFNDLKTIMNNSGSAMMGMGIASGENRATDAALEAIHSPLLEEKNLSHAKRAVINVGLGIDGTLKDFEAVGDVVKTFTAEDAQVIMGTSVDESLGDNIKVTIIATDFQCESEEEIEEPKIVIQEKPIIEEKIRVEDQDELPSFIKTKKQHASFFNKDNLPSLEDNQTLDDPINTIDSTPQIIDDKKEVEKVIKEEPKKEEPSIPNFLKKRI